MIYAITMRNHVTTSVSTQIEIYSSSEGKLGAYTILLTEAPECKMELANANNIFSYTHTVHHRQCMADENKHTRPQLTMLYLSVVPIIIICY